MTQSGHQFPSRLEPYLPPFDAWVRGGKTPHDAALSAKLFGLSGEDCEVLRAEYLRRNQKFIDYTDPRVLRDNPRIESWYSGPDQDGAWCWPPYKAMVWAPERGWDQHDLLALDRASTKILASLPHPATNSFNCRGLVVGYVQSGKTANYSALISKAADVGYRLFIVLSGITSSLRQQTQSRLNSDVVEHSPGNWSWLTYPERDFLGSPAGPDGVIDVQSHRKRVVAVVKKNVKILDRLIGWLRSASPDTLAACPAIVIDDEADNASVNTRDPDVDPSAVNREIRRLLRSLPRVAYVGYTATPFANIFIDPRIPEDLFPRNFIFDLERPKAYFGAERIFGRELLKVDDATAELDGLDIVREVKISEPDEPGMLLPTRPADRFSFQPSLPPSLKRAIDYFVLATAARYARGQINKHSSMLVHTTMYVDLHDKMSAVLDGRLNELKSALSDEQESLREIWEDESKKVSPEVGEQTTFEAVWRQVPTVLERALVVVDNGRVESALTYNDFIPSVVIAVGGNTFSRGLTLQGLVVSYYVRRAGAYDTLLQMGRWFGYRPGYDDLPRIWMTNELQEQFLFLAGIEEEIRLDIRRLEREQRSPLDLAIRVRTHPKLLITARNKMGTAKLASASFSERTVQSFLFKHDDVDWLRSNIDAVAALAESVRDSVESIGQGRFLARRVAAAQVRDFLQRFRFHPDQSELRADLLDHYIREENNLGALREWNVAWIGQGTEQPDLGRMFLGLKGPLNCINRARFRMTSPCNIKALISSPDRIVDLPEIPRIADNDDILDARNRLAPGIGLLLFYPISKASSPESKGKTHRGLCLTCGMEHPIPDGKAAVRHPLRAAENIVGAALVFPKSQRPEVDYMANDLADLFRPEESVDGELIPDDESEIDR